MRPLIHSEFSRVLLGAGSVYDGRFSYRVKDLGRARDACMCCVKAGGERMEKKRVKMDGRE